MGSEKGSLKGKIFVLRWWIIPFACYFHSESSHCSHSRNRTGLTKSLSLSYLLIVLIFSVSLLCCYLLLVSPYEVGSRSNSSFHYFSSRTNFVITLLLHGHLGGKDNICFLNTGHLVDIFIQILFTWWWRSLSFSVWVSLFWTMLFLWEQSYILIYFNYACWQIELHSQSLVHADEYFWC